MTLFNLIAVLFRKYYGRFILLQVLFIISRFIHPFLITPYFTKLIAIISTTNAINLAGSIKITLIQFLLCNAYVSLHSIISGIILAYLFPEIETNVRKIIFDYVKNLEYSIVVENFGEILKPIEILSDLLPQTLHKLISSLIPGAITLFFILIELAKLNSIICFVLILWFVMLLSLSIFGGFKMQKICANQIDIYEKINNFLIEQLNSTAVRRFFHVPSDQELEQLHFFEQNNKKEIIIMKQVLNFLKKIICFLFPQLILLLLMIKLYSLKYFSKQVLLLFFNLNAVMINMAWSFCDQLPEIYSDFSKCVIAMKVTELPIYKDNGKKNMDEANGNMSLKDLTVMHPRYSDFPIVEKLCLEIEHGDRVEIQGVSGSGKTTIMQSLCGFSSNFSGSVLYDGVTFKEISPFSRSKYMSYLPANPIIFNKSLDYNLTFDYPNIKKAECINIMKSLNLDDLLYLTGTLGTNGDRLSEGQKQRLSIARFLLLGESCQILFADEPFSALDKETIEITLSVLLKYYKGTIICVDHTGTFKKIATKSIILNSTAKI